MSNSRVIWFHCFAGIAGDMALSSLIDGGADFDEIRIMLERLPLRGWTLCPEPVLRSGIASTYLRVDAEGDGTVRTFPAMRTLINEAKLPPRVEARSLAAFSALAHAEARLHRSHPDEIHFHELAGYDTILDIVGTMIALEILAIDDVYASAVSVGTGTIRTEHGVLPNPAPAVLELLHGAPVTGRDIAMELTTPTGAAILATLVHSFGPMPAMTVEGVGYGAGTKEIEGLANCTQVVIGQLQAALGENVSGQPLIHLAANLDDATGELLADTVAALLSGGAADAWITPVIMKKGRPGHIVNALCDVSLAPQLRATLMAESGSFGVRSSTVDRFAASRSIETVVVDGHVLRVKVSAGRAKVEHDDALSVAQTLGIAVRDVISRAEQAWREGQI